MGLAASQARFLAITSRKANCEFRSMEIAQDKLSVTRELAEVSQNYQNALNQTSLVWDFDGSGQDLYNLSYGVLMTPTMLNNFTPYLITNRAGAVVLNGQMAKAAAAISADGAPAVSSATGFAAFMDALGVAGVIPESMVRDIRSITDHHYKYKDAAGNDISLLNPTPQEIADTGAYLDGAYTNGYNKGAGYGAEPLNKNGACASNVLGLAYKIEEANLGVITDYLTNCDAIYVNGTKASDITKSKLTLDQILTNEVIAVQTYEDGHHALNDTYKFVDRNGDKDFDDVGEKETVGLMNGLGLGPDDTAGLYGALVGAFKELLVTDAVTAAAFNAADIATRDQYRCSKEDYKTLSGDQKSESSVISSLKSTSSEYNQLIFYENEGGKYNSGIGVNLTHMLGYLLTQFENCLNGYDTYFAGPTYSGSSFVTDDMGYGFVMKDKEAVTSEVVLKADFYMQLYNNICASGWTESDKIDIDSEYLEQMLKNGNYFISSLNQDGYFYQGRYNEADCVVEVKDQDAIAQAEAEFTTLKAKLTYKEDKLDLEMKNLDAEISALTTEYDSVKGLISKNVEKIFQMFQ